MIRCFRCPECGSFMYAPKKKRSEKKHVKTMWCWKCKEERDMEFVENINERRR